ncbi:MAG TPA: hypothetical protein VGL24_08600 [Chthoniobacterales bacterium]
MDTEAFVDWALDDVRTREQKYTVEVLVEQGIRHWNSHRKIYESEPFEDSYARSRERKLNPAYAPTYSEEGLRKTAESLADLKNWTPSGHTITNLDALRFFPTLEWVWIHGCGAADLSPLASLPALRKLLLGSLGNDFGGGPAEDYTFLARCSALREITLGFGATWPDFTGLEKLQQLELLEISGNLLALPRGLSFPKVRKAKLYCRPLYARAFADFPQVPACEILTLFGAERLDGIEKMPRLRNLTLHGHCRSFAPLTALQHLTWLNVEPLDHRDYETLPRDISPIAQLPALRSFQIGPPHAVLPDMPRDYLAMAEAPALRELHVRSCPPVQMEVASIQAGLPPWDDVFLREEPRPLGPLQMVLAPVLKQPAWEEQFDPGDDGVIDLGLRDCESRWVQHFAHRHIAERVQNPDWGTVGASGTHRNINLTIESFDVVERLPDIIHAAREVIARLRSDYRGSFGVHLKVKPPQLTPAQQELEDRLQKERDEWEWEQHRRDKTEYLERLHELELKQQQGVEIDPEEFSPTPEGEYPQRPKKPAGEEIGGADDEAGFESDEGDGGGEEGEIAVATEPDPPPSLDEEEHPLAANYLCAGTILLDEVWFYSHFRGIGGHLMQRQFDREIPEEPKPDA